MVKYRWRVDDKELCEDDDSDEDEDDSEADGSEGKGEGLVRRSR